VFKRLRPWQAAGALTGVLFVAQLLLLLITHDSGGGGSEELTSLSPLPSEIALNAAAVFLWFAVLWLVFSVAAWMRVRRARTDG
jgi:hypothetical protein